MKARLRPGFFMHRVLAIAWTKTAGNADIRLSRDHLETLKLIQSSAFRQIESALCPIAVQTAGMHRFFSK
jgi:hypothetical protein